MRKQTANKKTRTVDLRQEDVVRISKLKAHFQRQSPVGVKEIDAMRLGWKEACVALGLEQRTDVERIEADVPNGYAGKVGA
jgi:hypothetical protein